MIIFIINLSFCEGLFSTFFHDPFIKLHSANSYTLLLLNSLHNETIIIICISKTAEI